jgi:hypothetical protein
MIRADESDYLLNILILPRPYYVHTDRVSMTICSYNTLDTDSETARNPNKSHSYRTVSYSSRTQLGFSSPHVTRQI